MHIIIILNQFNTAFSGLSQACVVPSKSNILQAHYMSSSIRCYVAELLSLYQLVLFVFVYVSLSIQRSPELSFYHCLQSSSLLYLILLLILINFYKLLYNTEISNLLSRPSFITSRQSITSMSNFLGLFFVVNEFDRQTMVLLYR